MTAMENVIKTGYLKKGSLSNRISAVLRRTPRRWYVYGVRDGTQPFLEYYESEASTFTSAPINCFDLTGCKKITYVLSPRNPNLTFCIVLEDRVIELTALTRSDLIDWCDRMERSLRQLGYLDSVRGPDDDHVYVDAPFLQRRNPKSQETGTEEDSVIHTSVSDVQTPAYLDHYQPEEVPGMVFVPSITRNRPITIAVYPSGSQTLPSLGKEAGQKSLERRSSLRSTILVEEKDNSSSGRSSKSLHRSSTINVPVRRKGMARTWSAACDSETVNNGELDTAGLTILTDEKLKETVLNSEVQYGNLTEWSSAMNSNNYTDINTNQSICTRNQDKTPVSPKSGQYELATGFFQKDENDNQTMLEDPWDITLEIAGKPLNNETSVSNHSLGSGIRISPPSNSEVTVDKTHLAIPPQTRQTTEDITGAGLTVNLSPITKMFPDDEQVCANVKELLKYFDSCEVSGSSEHCDHDEDSGEQMSDLNGDRPESPVFESLTDLGMNNHFLFSLPEPPTLPKRNSSSDSASNPLLKNSLNVHSKSAQTPSPDMGYMSDKSPNMEDEPNPPKVPCTTSADDLKLSPKLNFMKDDTKTKGDASVPPPLPDRPANLDRVRPMTMNPTVSRAGNGQGAALIPRRTLSVMQQVHGASSGAQSVVPLKMSQAELFRENITSPVAKPVELKRRDCLGTIAFVDAYGSVWIAGWNQRARPRLHGALHIGDRLITINNEFINSASAARKFIKHCRNENLVFEVKTAPKAKVISIRRSAPGQSLGFKRDGGTAEIIYIDPNGLAAQHGLSCRAATMDNSGFCNWVLTEVNSRPLNLFLKKNEIAPMLDAVGREISIVVQPVDFINALKRQVKHLKNYKEYLLP